MPHPSAVQPSGIRAGVRTRCVVTVADPEARGRASVTGGWWGGCFSWVTLVMFSWIRTTKGFSLYRAVRLSLSAIYSLQLIQSDFSVGPDYSEGILRDQTPLG